MLHVRKVIEHVYEKLVGGDNNSHTGSTANSNDKQDPGGQGSGGSSQHGEEEDDLASIAEAKVELLCQDQVRICIITIAMMLTCGFAKMLFYILKKSNIVKSFKNHKCFQH